MMTLQRKLEVAKAMPILHVKGRIQNMLDINWADVISVLNSCKPYLIGFGIVALLAIIIMVACMKMEKRKKKLIRKQAGIAILLAAVVTANLVSFGPLSSLITLATGGGTITKETSEAAGALSEEIAEEGIVLLKNDSLLPIAADSKLNVFGWASTNPCYGGTGSGSLSDAYETVSLLQGLENAGFTLNNELSDFYTSYRSDRPVVGMFEQDFTLPEPPADTYTDTLLGNAKAFSDTAVVVITRVGGEGADLPTDISKVTFNDNSEDYKEFEEGEHFLQLSQSEKDMVELVCSNFNNVVLVYNGANAFEFGFLNEYPQIKSAIWCPGTGQSGFNALGSIISGAVNPSGKTTDTVVYDLESTPTANNFGSYTYTNMDEFPGDNFGTPTVPTFINYVEGIYVGYKFYETAAHEGLINYDENVLYPFGYGLTYTDFTQTMSEITENDGVLSFDVTVTNTGSVAGKDVIQAYYNPPYTNGGIEKATTNLIEFAKTKMLEPGESETISLSFNLEDMASYDDKDAKAYVLEEGNYDISINSNSHEVIETKTYTVDTTVVYSGDNSKSTDEITATNVFDYANGGLTYLSRQDGFSNYEEATKAPASFEMPQEYKDTFVNNSNYNPEDYNNADDVMPTLGAKNDIVLMDLRGADYDDPRWETLLDNLTVEEMNTLISLGGYQTAEAKSVGKIGTVDCDGPASINNNFTGVGSLGFPSAIMIGCTWNKDIAEAFGNSIGKMADEMGVSGWYAPALNIHRSAFAGRNFEYYSEDPILSGWMAAKATAGAESQGVYAYLKHFALNDQETNRNSMLCTWSNEQAIREIYLKAFEIAVKEGGAKAMMSSFNYIGTEYAGANSDLLQTVLRDEWGFRGMVITDYFGVYGYQNADQEIRNGNDLMLVAYDAGTNQVKDQSSATSIIAMRQASKNIMYTVVNSRAYFDENYSLEMAMWKKLAIGADVVLAGVLILLEVRTIRKFRRSKKEVEA